MYKCGWNGCEKAYGTLNHLNAHVTMQGHGTKRTPEGMHLSFSDRSALARRYALVELHGWVSDRSSGQPCLDLSRTKLTA